MNLSNINNGIYDPHLEFSFSLEDSKLNPLIIQNMITILGNFLILAKYTSDMLFIAKYHVKNKEKEETFNNKEKATKEESQQYINEIKLTIEDSRDFLEVYGFYHHLIKIHGLDIFHIYEYLKFIKDSQGIPCDLYKGKDVVETTFFQIRALSYLLTTLHLYENDDLLMYNCYINNPKGCGEYKEWALKEGKFILADIFGKISGV